MVFVPGMVNGVLGWHLNPEPTGWKAQTNPLSYGCPTLFFERLKAKQIEWRGELATKAQYLQSFFISLCSGFDSKSHHLNAFYDLFYQYHNYLSFQFLTEL